MHIDLQVAYYNIEYATIIVDTIQKCWILLVVVHNQTT
jgi:hypothetical protein